MKRKLLFAMLCIIGALGLRAQTWTASEVGEGYALLYNVGAGQYFTRGNGWNTQASVGDKGAAMVVELIAEGSNYRIRTGVDKEAYGLENLSGGTCYTDQSRNKKSTWTFTQVDTQNGPVYNIVSADNHGGGSGAYLTKGEGTIVGPGNDGSAAEAKWKVFLFKNQQEMLKLAMAEASEENPVDVTAFLLNTDFASAPSISSKFWTMQSSNYNPNGGGLTNPCAESWRATFTLEQTATVPNGLYKLRAQAAVTEYNVTGADMPVVYLNDANVQFTSMVNSENAMSQLSTRFANDEYWTDYTDNVVVVNNTINVGVKGTRTDTWCVWDNFQLLYVGDLPLSVYEESLDEAIAEGEEYDADVPAAAMEAIKNVLDEAKAKKGEMTQKEDFSDAIQRIKDAIAAANALTGPYARYNAVKASILAVSDADLSEVDAEVEATTDTKVLSEAVVKARAIFTTYLADANYDDVDIELTAAMIDNATPTSNADYWTVTDASGNAASATFDAGNNNAEFWNKAAHSIKQTLPSMPAGFYRLTAVAVTRDGMQGILSANDNALSIVTMPNSGSSAGVDFLNSRAHCKTYFDAGNGVNELTFSLDEAQDLTIGLTADNTTGDHWIVWRSFGLQYLGTAPLIALGDMLQNVIDDAKYQATILAVPSAIAKSVTEVAEKYEAEMGDYSEAAEFTAAIEAVKKALADAETAIAPMTQNSDVLWQAETTAGLEELSTEAKSTLQDVIDNNNTELGNCKTIAEIEALTAALKKGISEAIASIELTGTTTVDLTYLLTNPGFEAGNVNGWTNSGAQAAAAQGNKAFDNTQGDYYAERWHAAGTVDLNQTMRYMPEGYYVISAYLYTDTQDGKLYANEASTAFAISGQYSVMTQLTEAGDLKFGASCTLTASTWICMDDFTVEYLGKNPVGIFKAELQAAIDAAKAHADELSVPTGVKNTLKEAAAGYEEAMEAYTTVAECQEAAKALAEDVKTAEAAVAPAVRNTAVLAKATTTAGLEKVGAAAKETLQSVIDGNAAALDACKDVAEIEAQTSKVWNAIAAALGSVELAGEEELDLTFLLTNPDLTDIDSWTHPEGWYTDQPEGGNSQVMNNDNATSEDGTKTKFYEYWTPTTARANNLFALYQKVTLPEGAYSISCYAFAQDQYQHANTVGVYFYANDTQGSAVTNARLSEAQIDFVNTEAQEVKIGLKTINPNTYNWMGIGYMTLKMVAKKTLEISENADYVPASAAGDVKLTRTIKADTWNTLVLPFALNEAELKAAFGEDVQVAEESEVAHEDNSTINFNTMEVPAITPNKPVLVKTAMAGSEYTFQNRTIAAGEAKVAGTNFDFVGTYAASTKVAAGDYFISADKLYQSKGETAVKGTRAYLKAKAAGVRAELFIDGVATAIESLDADMQQTGAIYNLSGQRVQKTLKGLYIVGGKKVMVK